VVTAPKQFRKLPLNPPSFTDAIADISTPTWLGLSDKAKTIKP
jgi:hypothetical protein